MSKRDVYKILLSTLGNSTKLSIVFLLSHNDRMTVTQMAKHVGVTKANLYHFVSQMVKDGLLSKPEAVVKENYVEKYYRLAPKLFESIDPSEQRKRIKSSTPEEMRTILQSALASLGLDFRLLAEEVARADEKMLGQIARSVKEERLTISYAILPDKAYEYALAELKRINKTIMQKWGSESSSMKGNRVIIVGLPQFGIERSSKQASTSGSSTHLTA